MTRGPHPATERPLRILLVEDDPDDAEITRFAAQRTLPCEVEVVPDGARALDVLRRRATAACARPDVVLLDLRLPGASGLEILRYLRREAAYRQTPAIVLTTTGIDEETILACYTAGASSFLQKPATDARFAEALRVLTLGRATLSAPPSTGR